MGPRLTTKPNPSSAPTDEPSKNESGVGACKRTSVVLLFSWCRVAVSSTGSCGRRQLPTSVSPARSAVRGDGVSRGAMRAFRYLVPSCCSTSTPPTPIGRPSSPAIQYPMPADRQRSAHACRCWEAVVRSGKGGSYIRSYPVGSMYHRRMSVSSASCAINGRKTRRSVCTGVTGLILRGGQAPLDIPGNEMRQSDNRLATRLSDR